MKRISSVLSIAMLCAAAASAQVSTIQTDFAAGIPEGFTLLNTDGMGFNSSHFSPKTQPSDTWYAGEAPADHSREGVKAALSNSHRNFADAQTSDWLILPQLTVEKGTILSWRAKSISYSLREDYMVMIASEGTSLLDYEEVYSVKEEGYLWTTHCLDLSKYEGKEISIAFLHCSTHKFLLALTDLFAGVPEKADITAVNTGLHFFSKADETPCVKATLFNSGAAAKVNRLVLSQSDSDKSWELATDCTLATGERREFELPIAAEGNFAFRYDLTAELEDGTTVPLFSDFINKSDCLRKLFIEKFTGKWCNNCPSVMPPSHLAFETLKDECVNLEIHHDGGQGYDNLGNSDYFRVEEKVYYSVCGDFPALWFNRTAQHNTNSPTDTEAFYKACLQPCVADLTLKAHYNDAGKIVMKADATFADNASNPDDTYRVAYTIVQDEIMCGEKESRQTNKLSSLGVYYGEAHYVSSYFNNDQIVFHNVVVYGKDSWKGIAGTLPTEINAGETYTHAQLVEVPEATRNAEGLRVIATLVNTSVSPYQVMNSAIAPIDPYEESEFDENPGTDDPGTDEPADSSVGELQNSVASFSIYSVDGSLIKSNASTEDVAHLRPGLYIVNGRKMVVL